MSHRFKRFVFGLSLVFLAFGICFAQEDNDVLTGERSDFLVLSELSFGVGWPGYQIYHANLGFQKDAFGMNFRGSFTNQGPYFALSGRYYTPIPVPVPTFISAGAGYAANAPVGFASFGAQIPFGLSSPFRATVEAGISLSPSETDGLQISPTASLTIGYLFFIDTTPLTEEELREREFASSLPGKCCGLASRPFGT